MFGNETNKLDFDNLESKTIKVDNLDEPSKFHRDEPSFGTYLLGYDSLADHKIIFVKKHSSSIYDIEWSGKIALTYSGDYEFKHHYFARIEKAKFEGFSFEGEITDEEISKYLVNTQLFEVNEKIIQFKS